MEVFTTRDELRNWLATREGRRRILVPTMGALHAGHTSLFQLAVSEAGKDGDVLASIFVNPTQFGPGEDFDAYPRKLESDLAECRDHGVTAVFAPPPEEIYLPDASINITESNLSKHLCGASRPGHFDGVCLVVAKLFHITQPSAAVFGEKDFQQLAIIRRLVRDLDFPIEIIGGSTVRESDGLALSSRNAYLSSRDRNEAPLIHAALSEASQLIASGEMEEAEQALTYMRSKLEEAPHAVIDYLAVVDEETLEPIENLKEGTPRLLAAVFFGKTRLIDNVGVPENSD
ncbi:MAG: pantoate--beta-alanine ligase [Verrucomicrobiota bacterium]